MEKFIFWAIPVCLVLFLTLNYIGKSGSRKMLCRIGNIAMLTGIAGVLYNSPVFRWAYIDGLPLWNYGITLIGTFALAALAYWIVKKRIQLQEEAEIRLKAQKAGMSPEEFAKWRTHTLKTLRNNLTDKYGIVFGQDLQRLYNGEEEKLFSSRN